MTNHPDTSTTPTPPTERDEGSVLPLILALMVVGSLAVVALLTFATTLFMNRPPIEVRDGTFWSAKSAMSIAMVEQTSFGPGGCYKAAADYPLNGYTAKVSCAVVSTLTDAKGRLGVITTSNASNQNQFSGNGPGAVIKPVTGNVFVNGGNLDNTSRDLNVTGTLFLSGYDSPNSVAARYQNNAALPTPVAAACTDPMIAAQAAVAYAPTYATQCQLPTGPGADNAAWYRYAGDQPLPGDPYAYPALPPLPLYTRVSAAQATIGSCRVYFPGQYDAPLTLAAGDHYFASGVYYFNSTVTLAAGARVVAGEGRSIGCAVDAEAAFATNAPKAHSISGKGATFVFGGAGRLISTNASLQINRRVSSSTTRGSEGVAIRSVNFTATPPATPQPTEIPNDAVVVGDVYDSKNPTCNSALSLTRCMQAASAHTVQVTTTAPIRSYTASTLGVADDIVQITQTSGTASTNQFVADGYVFVPNAKISLNGGTNANYRMRMTGGIVASSIKAAYQNLPSTPASNWFLGVQSVPRQVEVSLLASVTAPNGQRSLSRATLQVNENKTYAIKGWTVDPNVQTPTTTTTTTTLPPTTTTTTTLPPPTTTSTTTTTTTTTTTLPPTTTTTTLPPVPATPGNGTCNLAGSPGGWNRDFGPGSWTAEYWNWGSALPAAFGSNPFPGTATKQTTVANIDACGDLVPFTGVQNNLFTARFTKTYTTTAPRTTTFLAGGDDGFRVKINGTTVIDHWSVHAHQWRTATIVLPAGTNTIVFEFYENSGQNTYQLWKN